MNRVTDPDTQALFEKLQEAIEEHGTLLSLRAGDTEVSSRDLDEIEEIRRFAAELQAIEPASFTIS